jgi:hypothetical protein
MMEEGGAAGKNASKVTRVKMAPWGFRVTISVNAKVWKPYFISATYTSKCP